MSLALDKLLQEALQLTQAERVELAERLYETLPDPGPYHGFATPALDAEWQAEIQRRIEDLDSGRTEPIPWEQVDKGLRGLTGGKAD